MCSWASDRGDSQIVVIGQSIEQHKMLATDGDLVRVLIVGDNLEGVVDMNEEILFDKDKDDHLRWKFELKKTFSLQRQKKRRSFREKLCQSSKVLPK